MKKRKIGELTVSSVGFGCMGLSHAYGPAVPRDEAVRLIREPHGPVTLILTPRNAFSALIRTGPLQITKKWLETRCARFERRS